MLLSLEAANTTTLLDLLLLRLCLMHKSLGTKQLLLACKDCASALYDTAINAKSIVDEICGGIKQGVTGGKQT